MVFLEKCPDEEVEECLVYECARRSELWPFVFKTLRKLGKLTSFRAFDEGWPVVFELLKLNPEFPSQPWLSIPPEKRRARLNKLLERSQTWRPVELASAADFEAKCNLRSQFGISHEWPRFEEDRSRLITGGWHTISEESGSPSWDARELLRRYRKFDRLADGYLLATRVDWKFSDAELIESFTALLKRERPADFGMYNRRGKTSSRQDGMRAVLRTLGAWSLSRRNTDLPITLSRNAAMNLKAENENGAFEHLYPSVEDLKRAEKRAVKRIDAMSPWQLRCSHVDSKQAAFLPSYTDTEGGVAARVHKGNIYFYRKWRDPKKR